jgi:F-type H+-transporting ATPase subunit delta
MTKQLRQSAAEEQGTQATVLVEEQGRTLAAVRTAVPLTHAQQAMIVRRLEAHVGQPLRAQFEVDPSLLGGVQAQVGDQLIDDTVRWRLSALREALIKSGEST